MKTTLLIILLAIAAQVNGQGQYSVCIGEICNDSINYFDSFQWCVDFECPELQQYPELIKYLHHIEKLELHKYHGDSTVFILTRKIITEGIASIFKRNTFIKNLLSGWQDTTIMLDNIDRVMFYTDPGSKPNIIIGTWQEPAIFNIITDQMLFEYETDCYNDSTLYKKGTLMVRDVGNGNMAGGINYVDTWIHKQPTFPDFIKWLHNRNN